MKPRKSPDTRAVAATPPAGRSVVCAYHLRLERTMARLEAKLDAIGQGLAELRERQRELQQRNGARALEVARLDVKVAALVGGIAVLGTTLVNLGFRLLVRT